jgi:protein-L-isoaspartate(D-aspartate) O-methyltransferase
VMQLRDGGRLVQPIGRGGAEAVTLFELHGGQLERRARVIPAHFVKLYGDYGFTPEDPPQTTT